MSRRSVLRGHSHRRHRTFPVTRRQMWRIITKSEDEARAASLFLRYVLNVPCKSYRGAVFPPEGDGLPMWEVEARTTSALVEEAATFAAGVVANGMSVHIVNGELLTVQPLVRASRREMPAKCERPPLRDYLTPSGMFCGQPVYSLPSPEEAERIVKQIRESGGTL